MMSIRSGIDLANFSQSNSIKQMRPERKIDTAKSLYSGMTSAQNGTQQQQPQRYFGSAPRRQSKRESERINTVVVKKSGPPAEYHAWEVDYSKIITRQRRLKPMTKDPYTPLTRLISHAVEKMTTENECQLTLIPAKAVKVRTVKIREFSKPPPPPPQPVTIRYLRRNELLPSEQTKQGLRSERISLLPCTEYNTPVVPFVDTNKTIDVARKLTVADRLMNRAKMRTDPSVIRRPPRRLIISAAQETVMPLSVYG